MSWLKWAVAAFWVVLVVVVSPLAAELTGVQSNDQVSWLPRDAEATAALTRTGAAFPESDEQVAVLVYQRETGLTGADRAKADVDRTALARYAKSGRIDSAQSSADGRALLLSFPLAAEGDQERDVAVAAIRAQLAEGRPDGLRAVLTGSVGVFADLLDAASGVDSTLIFVTAGVVAVLLLLIYRSPVLWLLPLLTVGVASQVASATVYLLVRHAGVTVDAMSQGVLTVLVFGAGTDYALLLIARYRQELRRRPDRHEAMAAALRASGPAIVASAATVVIGLLCLLAADMSSTRGLGPVAAVGIVAALATMTTLLPALLVIGGRWLFWPFVPRLDTTAEPVVRQGVWSRIAGVVGRRPRVIWVATSLIMAGLALGMLGMRVGLPQTAFFTTTVDSVTGQELITEHFPAGAAEPADVTTVARRADAVTAAARAVPGVAGVQPAQLSADGEWARIPAVLADAPGSSGAKATVTRLRDAVHAVPDAQALVGGQTATALDIDNASDRDNRTVMPLILGVVFAVLVLVLRALLAPLLLIASVVLSFATTMGLTTLLFNALGYPRIDASLPILAFLFLVALGVDYTIFLMVRAREEIATLGHRAGILRTLNVTGSVITSAGLVLAATFAVLISFPLVNTLHMGIIVAVGILIDTLIVRTLLVPALAIHIGPRIWWPSRHSP